MNEELAAIRARDAESGATWFTGPASFTAQAARDRRTLLGLLEEAMKLPHQLPEGGRPPAMPTKRTDGRPPRSYPLQAPTAVMVKLGSIVVHVQELMGPQERLSNRMALKSLLEDPEVTEWLAAMDKLAFLPRKQ